MRKSLTVVLLLLIINYAWVSAQTPSGKVIVYSDDFAGNKLELGLGRYDYMFLVRAGSMVVRSVKVPPGMRVILYERDNFEGGSLVITESIRQAQLEAKGFGNITMNVSIVVEKLPDESLPPPGTFVTIFAEDFSGASKSLVAGRYDYAELGEIGNDQISSIKVPKGMKVTLYEHGGFKGRTSTFTADVSVAALKTKNFNNVASGVVVEQMESVPTVEQKPIEKESSSTVTVVALDGDISDAPSKRPVLNEPSEPLIYQGDFSGASKSLSPGRYTKDRLGIADNELSSIRIPKGFRVTLYDGDAFEGRSLVLASDANASFFVDNNFNNLTSSIWVEALLMATVYEGDYGGVSARLVPGRYVGHDFGIGNDQLSSARVPQGLKVTLYEDENFGGRSLILTGDSGADVLNANSFNNETSSLLVEEVVAGQVQDQPVSNGPFVIVYADKFSGQSQKLTPGRYLLKDLTVGNDQVSSATVPVGLRLTLFEDDNFKGYSLTTENNIDLAVSKVFNERASSVIVEEIAPEVVLPDPVQPVKVIPAVTTTEIQVPEPKQSSSCEMTDGQFEKAYRSIEAKHFMEEMMTTARLTTKGHCLSIIQIRRIAKLFMSDDQSLEFVKYAYDLSMEKEDYYLLEDAFKFTSTRDEFQRFLSDK